MARPLKIGTLTFHKCFNYGAYWQARLMVEWLRRRGHDAEILDHRAWRAELSEWHCGLNPELPVRSPWRDYPAYARKLLAFRAARARLPLSRPFPLRRPGALDAYDLIVVGSDEVWNLQHPWYGGAPLFFGAGLESLPLVAYAASFGNHPASEPVPPALARSLQRFRAIAVRDANSRQLIQQTLDIDPTLVLDPCLLVTPEEVEEAPAGPGTEPYAVVYGFGFSAAFARSVQGWARAAGVRLVSVGYRNPWADDHQLAAGPEAFRRLMQGARAVATNYFHGCVFALRYNRPLVCEALPYRAIKIGDLLSTVGAEAHQVTPGLPAATVAARLDVPLDPGIQARIARLRADSVAYLDGALAGVPA